MNKPTHYLVADVAEKLGVKVETVRRYHCVGAMPPADDPVGRTPRWLAATIDEWIESRPGRGAGGGRPLKPKER